MVCLPKSNLLLPFVALLWTVSSFPFIARSSLHPSSSLFLAESASLDDVRILKMMLEEQAGGLQNGLNASPEERESIGSIIVSLESMNEEKELTTSPKLNGEWRLLYTTNTGSSAGKIGPLVGKVTQVVDLASRSYSNNVSILPGLSATLDATWENDAFSFQTLWTVIFKRLSFKVFGVAVGGKDLEQKGLWRMSFLDDSLRILHAKGGKNLPENVYVLTKVKK